MAAPSVPGDLDATGKKLYRDLRSAMQERPNGPTCWQDSDHHLLAQTCRYDMRARSARSALTEARSLVSEGDRKQLTVHPLVRVAEASERLFVDGLDRLGFSPKARASMGMEAKPSGESKFGL